MTISGARTVKMVDCGIDIIARVLVEKLLPYLVDGYAAELRRGRCPS